MKWVIQPELKDPDDLVGLESEPLVIHQRTSPTANQALIIFAHGLFGRRYGKKPTWGRYPQLVYEDFPELDVGLYSYRAIRRGYKFWRRLSFWDRVQNFVQTIRDTEYQTFILVGHSLGGLYCMAALAYLATRERSPEVLLRIGGLILHATP